MYYYCDSCGVVSESDTYCECLLSEIRYPNDMAREAEYDEPRCKGCGRYVHPYVCDVCGREGDSDYPKLYHANDIDSLVCAECYAKNMIHNELHALTGKVIREMTLKFGAYYDKESYKRVKHIVQQFIKNLVEL